MQPRDLVVAAGGTGAFVGMACQDLAGTGRHADFDYFRYRERDFHVHPFPDLADGF